MGEYITVTAQMPDRHPLRNEALGTYKRQDIGQTIPCARTDRLGYGPPSRFCTPKFWMDSLGDRFWYLKVSDDTTYNAKSAPKAHQAKSAPKHNGNAGPKNNKQSYICYSNYSNNNCWQLWSPDFEILSKAMYSGYSPPQQHVWGRMTGKTVYDGRSPILTHHFHRRLAAYGSSPKVVPDSASAQTDLRRLQTAEVPHRRRLEELTGYPTISRILREEERSRRTSNLPPRV